MSFLALAAIIVIGVASNWDIFVDYIGIVLVAVFLHDALALAARLRRSAARRGCRRRSVKAMTFEVGVRNAGLGLLLVFTYFDGLGGMALVAAWWGIWDIIAGLAVADGVADRRTPHRRPVGGRGMRVLVTGGNGFLGSSVVAGLAEAGHEVVSADLRFPTSEVAGVRHVLMDVTDAAAVDAVIAEAAPEVVVHLASIVTPGRTRPASRSTPSTSTAPGTCSTRAWPTAYAGWWCRPAARPTATTPTTRRG